MSFLWSDSVITPSRKLRLRRIYHQAMRQFNSYEDLHPEWKKPPFPYEVGAKIQVHPHKPPSLPVPRLPMVYDDMVEREESSPLDRCLKHPPSPGDDGEGAFMLEIIELVDAADGKRSQLVLVRVGPSGGTEHGNEGSLPPFPAELNVVAKFYDPLYFDHDQGDGDPFKSLDSGYSFEAEAYSKMSRLQGNAIPKYYGSYTTSFPVPVADGKEQQRRHVRLILIEFIQGKSMQHASPQDYTQKQRQGIVGCIIDAETAIYANDIVLLDLYPRNIIIKQDDKGSALATRPTQPLSQPQEWPVVLLDFEIVHLDRHSPFYIKHFGRQHFMPGTVISPLLRWDEADKYEGFEGWIDWDWEVWIGERYGKDKASITDKMKEIWGPGLA